MKAASEILKDCQAKQIQYDPAEDGFVFSTAELETWMRRRDRHDAVYLGDDRRLGIEKAAAKAVE